MAQQIKTHYEKKNFIDQLASMTPSEINNYISQNGKRKQVSPFVRIERDKSNLGGNEK